MRFVVRDTYIKEDLMDFPTREEAEDYVASCKREDKQENDPFHCYDIIPTKIPIEHKNALYKLCELIVERGGFGTVTTKEAEDLGVPFGMWLRLAGLYQRSDEAVLYSAKEIIKKGEMI